MEGYLIEGLVGLVIFVLMLGFFDAFRSLKRELSYEKSESRRHLINLERVIVVAEKMYDDHNEFVDIAVNEELNRLSKLYYSERLDQVIEFRELTPIGDL